MKIGRRPGLTALALACASMLAPASAAAAQHVVDDDRQECPSAGFTSIAAAVAVAAPGDTVSVCDGTYLEGASGAGATSITIDKPLTVKGAGAGRVYVGPTGDLAASPPNLRDAAGNVISVTAGRTDISGLTIFGSGRHVEAGVAYLNADGKVSSVEIVDMVRAGQYTGTSGAGFVALGNEADKLRSVTLEDSLVESYDAAGVIVDATLADGALRANSTYGVFALLTGNRVSGAGAGGGVPGQDGLRVLNRASTVTVENTFTDNSDAGIDVLNSTTSSQQRFNLNNIQRNRVGFRHEAPFGVCQAGTGVPPEMVGQPNRYRLDAIQNWWGSPLGPSTDNAPGRGDLVSGDDSRGSGCSGAAPPAGTTDRLDFREFLGRPAPVPTPLQKFQDRQPTVRITAPAHGALLETGRPLAITAAAADDIGVHSVTFLRGDDVLATDTTAPYTATYTPQGDEAWTTQSITAIASDSRGQTSAHSIAVGGNDDAAPFVELLRPTKERRGWQLYAIADDDRQLDRVTFYVDGERACTDREPPFTCRIVPDFVPRERLTIVAIATDSEGQTATDIGVLRLPGKLKPNRLTLKADAERRSVFAHGELWLPAGVKRRDGCEGRVEVAIRQGGEVVDSDRVRLDDRCEYVARLRGQRGERYRVTARFLGNDLLKPIKANSRRVRLG